MNNWIPMQPALIQSNGSQTLDIDMPNTQISDNSYNLYPKWIQPIQTQHTTHPYEMTSFVFSIKPLIELILSSS